MSSNENLETKRSTSPADDELSYTPHDDTTSTSDDMHDDEENAGTSTEEDVHYHENYSNHHSVDETLDLFPQQYEKFDTDTLFYTKMDIDSVYIIERSLNSIIKVCNTESMFSIPSQVVRTNVARGSR